MAEDPSIKNEEEQERKDKLIFESLKQTRSEMISKSDKINEEARGLVGSILVVIGFILAAGTTSMVDVSIMFSTLYFIGVGLLLASIICVFSILHSRKSWVTSISLLRELLKEEQATYRTLLRKNILGIEDSIQGYNMQISVKTKLIRLVWLFLIVGLGMVMAFIIFSPHSLIEVAVDIVLTRQDAEAQGCINPNAPGSGIIAFTASEGRCAAGGGPPN